MRTVSLWLLSTLGLSGCLACHSAQTPVSAELPAATKPPGPPPPASDDTPNFRPLFHPGTQPNSPLAVFGSSGSRLPSPDPPQLDSFTQNSPDITVSPLTT